MQPYEGFSPRVLRPRTHSGKAERGGRKASSLESKKKEEETHQQPQGWTTPQGKEPPPNGGRLATRYFRNSGRISLGQLESGSTLNFLDFARQDANKSKQPRQLAHQESEDDEIEMEDGYVEDDEGDQEKAPSHTKKPSPGEAEDQRELMKNKHIEDVRGFIEKTSSKKGTPVRNEDEPVMVHSINIKATTRNPVNSEDSDADEQKKEESAERLKTKFKHRLDRNEYVSGRKFKKLQYYCDESFEEVRKLTNEGYEAFQEAKEETEPSLFTRKKIDCERSIMNIESSIEIYRRTVEEWRRTVMDISPLDQEDVEVEHELYTSYISMDRGRRDPAEISGAIRLAVNKWKKELLDKKKMFDLRAEIEARNWLQQPRNNTPKTIHHEAPYQAATTPRGGTHGASPQERKNRDLVLEDLVEKVERLSRQQMGYGMEDRSRSRGYAGPADYERSPQHTQQNPAPSFNGMQNYGAQSPPWQNQQPPRARGSEIMVTPMSIKFPIFSGDKLKWAEFSSLVQSEMDCYAGGNPMKKGLILKGQLAGEALAEVEHLDYSDPRCFDDAMDILRGLYEDEHNKATLYLEEIAGMHKKEMQVADAKELVLRLQGIVQRFIKNDPTNAASESTRFLILSKLPGSLRILITEEEELWQRKLGVGELMNFLRRKVNSAIKIRPWENEGRRGREEYSKQTHFEQRDRSQPRREEIQQTPYHPSRYERNHSNLDDSKQGHSYMDRRSSSKDYGQRPSGQPHGTPFGRDQGHQRREDHYFEEDSVHVATGSIKNPEETRNSATQKNPYTLGRMLTGTTTAVNKDTGMELPSYVVIDSGSAVNLIAERLAKKLNLKTSKKGNFAITGLLGTQISPVEGRRYVKLAITTKKGKINLECLVIKGTPIGELKHRPIDEADQNYLQQHKILLAAGQESTDNHAPEILVGSPNLMDILEFGQGTIKMPTGATLIPTTLGYMIAGISKPSESSLCVGAANPSTYIQDEEPATSEAVTVALKLNNK